MFFFAGSILAIAPLVDEHAYLFADYIKFAHVFTRGRVIDRSAG